MFDKLNPKSLLELMELGASVTIPCHASLEQNWGNVGFRGLIDMNNIELELFGDKCTSGSKYYFPLSVAGLSQAISFAEDEVKKYLSIE